VDGHEALLHLLSHENELILLVIGLSVIGLHHGLYRINVAIRHNSVINATLDSYAVNVAVDSCPLGLMQHRSDQKSVSAACSLLNLTRDKQTYLYLFWDILSTFSLFFGTQILSCHMTHLVSWQLSA